ncbi:CAP domain-containing protein [Pigmentiphaga litoralis]|uniref:CAP domain-containing protein n=1 Tax=Pigmentiphaga litoralis TaxID=516702 RepID=UPI003B42F0FC
MAGIAAMAAGMVVAGCGGGGDEGPAPGGSAAVSTEKPVEQPILTMPTSTYTGMHAEAFKRINEARIAAGVSALKQSVELDRAAQAHSDYQVRNNVFGHEQSSGQPLFTGVDYIQRARQQAYLNLPQTEVLARIGSTRSGANHINSHLNSVYHLAAILTPNANELGIGFAVESGGAPSVISSITIGTSDRRLPPVIEPWTWPVKDATDVPTTFVPYSETPNPLPDVASNYSIQVGPPIMYCTRVIRTVGMQVDFSGLNDVARARVVPGWILKHSSTQVTAPSGTDVRNDSNLIKAPHCVFVIPKEPLQKGTQYELTLKVVYEGRSSQTRWSFTTAS